LTERRLAESAGLAALVVLAMALRASHLGSPSLWVDEAESALNALTIVAEGLPVDRYLGIPLFENTLARPWPESAEYEFKDISYSDRGLSIYHGWLPLYAIAGAFRLAGVTPEAARSGTPPADGSTPELVRWTAVPRWPSIVFSGLFVLAAFGLGRRVGSTEVGWATALAAGLANIFVWFGRHARYYSATLALNAACGLAIWNACRRGRLRDYALAGLAIGLLFHTHALAAVTMAGVFVAALPLARRQPRLWLRVAVAAGVAGMLVLPWAQWSGFLGQMTHIPAARRYLDVKALLWSLPSTDPVVLLTCALGLAWFATAALVGNRIGERWRRPFLDQAPAFYFAIVWLALSYAVFVVAVPAASYFEMRLKLSVAVPGLLVNALVIGAASHAFRPQSRLLPVAGMLALLILSAQIPPRVASRPEPESGEYQIARLVRSWALGPGARVFAEPNDHLFLTYYAGRPVQSISPVRKAWLDRFGADLVIIDGPWYESLRADEVQQVARRQGLELTAEAANARAKELRWLVPALDLETSVAELRPRPRPLDDLDKALVTAVREKTRRAMEAVTAGTPLARAATFRHSREFWRFFFYWFSDPLARMGPGLNYRARLLTATAHLLPSGWIVYDCRPRREPPLVTSSP
jgi:Dolichyl-phosphate-mannose-protein mannosyltransferase